MARPDCWGTIPESQGPLVLVKASKCSAQPTVVTVSASWLIGCHQQETGHDYWLIQSSIVNGCASHQAQSKKQRQPQSRLPALAALTQPRPWPPRPMPMTNKSVTTCAWSCPPAFPTLTGVGWLQTANPWDRGLDPSIVATKITNSLQYWQTVGSNISVFPEVLHHGYHRDLSND